jgi:hypothetical protein
MNIRKLYLSLSLFLIIILNPVNSFARIGHYGLSMDYNHFDNQNQIIATIFKTERRSNIGEENLSMYNISLGLRTFNDSKAELIYKLTFLQGGGIIPITKKYEPEGEESEPLNPGARDYTFWNYFMGITILNIDKTQIEKFLIQWFQLSAGFGFDTFEPSKKDEFHINGFLSPKLGLSSVFLGSYNFNNLPNNDKNLFGIETGLNLLFDFCYKRKIFFKPYFDYSLFLSEMMINKISTGFIIDYYYYILINEYHGYRDYIKFSLVINENKYFIKNEDREFLKLDMGIKYYFRW